MNYDDFATDLSWLNLEEVAVPKKATSTKKGKSSGREVTIGGLSFRIEHIRYFSNETRAKLSKLHSGKTQSKEARLKMSLAKKGKKFSQSHKDTMSASVKKSIMTPEGLFHGVIYAASQLGINPATLKSWTKKYPDQYFYLD